jgi:hypothetical protein
VPFGGQTLLDSSSDDRDGLVRFQGRASSESRTYSRFRQTLLRLVLRHELREGYAVSNMVTWQASGASVVQPPCAFPPANAGQAIEETTTHL